jgi:hypothetical protein
MNKATHQNYNHPLQSEKRQTDRHNTGCFSWLFPPKSEPKGLSRRNGVRGRPAKRQLPHTNRRAAAGQGRATTAVVNLHHTRGMHQVAYPPPGRSGQGQQQSGPHGAAEYFQASQHRLGDYHRPPPILAPQSHYTTPSSEHSDYQVSLLDSSVSLPGNSTKKPSEPVSPI